MKTNFSDSYKRNGLTGLVTEANSLSKNNRFARRLTEFDRKHFVFYKILTDLSRLEKDIPRYGMRKQAAKLLKKLKINTAVYSDITNKNFQNQRGLLIYGVNHSAFIEPLILFSLLNQKNIKLVIFRLFYFLGKNIQKYTLPVATRKYSVESNAKFNGKFDIYQSFREFEGLADSEIAILNEKSISNAAETLANGGIVIIFPGGGGSELKKWGFGISRIILRIKKEKRNEVSLLPVYFSGMGYKRNLLRIYKAYKNKKLSNLRVGVYFGKEKTISEIYRLLGNELPRSRAVEYLKKDSSTYVRSSTLPSRRGILEHNKISEANILKYLREDAFSQYGLKEFPLKLYLQPQNYPLALSRSFMFMAKLFIQLLPFKDFFRT